jgi:hypothetical protein
MSKAGLLSVLGKRALGTSILCEVGDVDGWEVQFGFVGASVHSDQREAVWRKAMAVRKSRAKRSRLAEARFRNSLHCDTCMVYADARRRWGGLGTEVIM